MCMILCQIYHFWEEYNQISPFLYAIYLYEQNRPGLMQLIFFAETNTSFELLLSKSFYLPYLADISIQ